MKKIFTLLFAMLISAGAYTQGCIAIRSTGGMCNMAAHSDSTASEGSWLFSANNRYFKSFRHFRGKEEEKNRLVENTEVINYQYALDLAFTRVLNSRWSVMVDVPILANERSSLYEHGRTERRSTHSFGLGDIRVAAYRWLWNPQTAKKGNVQLGLGIKFPTGEENFKDYWYNVGPDGEKELRTVDQSIQLGDGGTGITAELNAFYKFSERFGVYGNLYYLSNPRENNGVRTYRETLSSTLANESIMSVPDQYLVRAGVNYTHRSLSATLGARLEGIPVYDLLGGSGDFRRPGYIWSLEPGITWQIKDVQLYATVPVALVRNRTQSVTDKENTKLTGEFKQGDAAFSDYAINVGISLPLTGKTHGTNAPVREFFHNTTDQ